MADETPPCATDKPPITTYVLVGDDHNGAFKGAVEGYSKQPNVVILRPADYPTIDAAIAAIKTPANLVIACHGLEDGSFTWNQNAPTEKEGYPAYSDLYHQLTVQEKTDIPICVNLACFGETGLDSKALYDAPPGMVVYSMIGNTPNAGQFITLFQRESSNLSDPTALMLEALDNLNPQYHRDIKDNKLNDGLDAFKALPTVIGIGGDSPVLIDLKHRSDDLTYTQESNPDAFKQAVRLVKDHFDAKATTFKAITGVLQEWGLTLEQLADYSGADQEAKKEAAEAI